MKDISKIMMCAVICTSAVIIANDICYTVLVLKDKDASKKPSYNPFKKEEKSKVKKW